MKNGDKTEMLLLLGLLVVIGVCPPIGTIIVLCIALSG